MPPRLFGGSAETSVARISLLERTSKYRGSSPAGSNITYLCVMQHHSRSQSPFKFRRLAGNSGKLLTGFCPQLGLVGSGGEKQVQTELQDTAYELGDLDQMTHFL